MDNFKILMITIINTIINYKFSRYTNPYRIKFNNNSLNIKIRWCNEDKFRCNPRLFKCLYNILQIWINKCNNLTTAFNNLKWTNSPPNKFNRSNNNNLKPFIIRIRLNNLRIISIHRNKKYKIRWYSKIIKRFLNLFPKPMILFLSHWTINLIKIRIFILKSEIVFLISNINIRPSNSRNNSFKNRINKTK